MAKRWLLCAAVSGLLAVFIGAFGAHGLKPYLVADLMAVYQTGVHYHFFHTFALLAVGILSVLSPSEVAFKWSGALFLVGIIVFSGSLYILSVTGARWLGAITPLGGVALIGGWLSMAIGIYHCQRINEV